MDSENWNHQAMFAIEHQLHVTSKSNGQAINSLAPLNASVSSIHTELKYITFILSWGEEILGH